MLTPSQYISNSMRTNKPDVNISIQNDFIRKFTYTIDNKRLILDWKLLSATVTIRVSRPQQDSDGRLQKEFVRYLSLREVKNRFTI